MRHLLVEPSPKIWITEAGGVREFTSSAGTKTFSIDHAQKQVSHVLSLVANETRVRGFLYYSWAGGPSFDSGLVRPVGPATGDAELKKLALLQTVYCPVFAAFRPGDTTSYCP